MDENQTQPLYQADPNPAGIPAEIRRWNWGAFYFNMMWGIGHRTYLPLLVLIPIFNLVWIFICGAKGNEWAWKAGNYSSAEEFLKMQSTWNRAGFVGFIISVVGVAIYVIFFASAMAGMIAMMGGGMGPGMGSGYGF